jgi:hypothetical protein
MCTNTGRDRFQQTLPNIVSRGKVMLATTYTVFCTLQYVVIFQNRKMEIKGDSTYRPGR